MGDVLDEAQHQNGNTNHLSDENDSHSDSETNINNNSNDYDESSSEPFSTSFKHNSNFKSGCLENGALLNDHDKSRNRKCSDDIDHSLGEIIQHQLPNSTI